MNGLGAHPSRGQLKQQMIRVEAGMRFVRGVICHATPSILLLPPPICRWSLGDA